MASVSKKSQGNDPLRFVDSADSSRSLRLDNAPRNQLDTSSVHFRSDTDEWATPQSLFDELHAEFAFDLDVCALASNAKCERYFTPETNGLLQEWSGACWMNPPYGRTIGQWMKKAYESSQAGGNRGRADSRSDRHPMVARMGHQRRSPFHSRTTSLRRSLRVRSVPLGHRDLPSTSYIRHAMAASLLPPRPTRECAP